jgi:hypothetical protein
MSVRRVRSPTPCRGWHFGGSTCVQGRGVRGHDGADDSAGRSDPLALHMGNAHKKAGLPVRITLDAKGYLGNELVAYGPQAR